MVTGTEKPCVQRGSGAFLDTVDFELDSDARTLN